MGGTRNPHCLKIGKSIWNYLLSHKITITAEYLPSRLNFRDDWESKNATDSSNWKLHRKVFLKITRLLKTPTVDLFASRVCHQLPQCMKWKPDPNSVATDAMRQDWNKMFAFAFPSFSLIGRVINKVLRENVETMILVTWQTPTWQTQPWYTLLLKTSSCENQVSEVSWVLNYMKTLEMEGISSNAAKLISMSRRPGSIAGYESDRNKVG